MEYSLVAPHIRLEDFEKFHFQQRVHNVPPVTMREVFWTIAVSLVCSPFFFATFFLIPMMGQITVGFAVLLTALYLWYRRSWVIAGIAVGGGSLFAGFMFAFIQSIKNNLEIPLFILIALGIPVTIMYCLFVGSRIWVVRGGAD
jgi:hypothetical protein